MDHKRAVRSLRALLLTASVLTAAPVLAQEQSTEARLDRLERLVEGLIARLDAEAGQTQQQTAAVAETGAANIKDMGRVMAALRAAHGAVLDIPVTDFELIKQRVAQGFRVVFPNRELGLRLESGQRGPHLVCSIGDETLLRFDVTFHAFEHFAHLLMHKIDCLQWSNHHFEFSDLSLLVAGNHVNSVHVFTFNISLKLQHCGAATENFFDVAERFVVIGRCA